MVNTGTGTRYIFRVVEIIMLEDKKNQADGYLVLQIGNVSQFLPKLLTESALKTLPGGNAIEIKGFHDRVRSDMISKAVEGLIINNYF